MVLRGLTCLRSNTVSVAEVVEVNCNRSEGVSKVIPCLKTGASSPSGTKPLQL